MATGQPTEVFSELEEYRMQHDMTYGELTERIAAVTLRRRDEDCWRRCCQLLTIRPHGRTVDIAAKFLAVVRAPAKRGRRRRVS